MNKEYFNKDYPTNVISFSYRNGLPDEVLGDIIISVEKAAEEALSSGITFYERLFSLIVHGIAHIMGYDHVNGGVEARKMSAKEKQYMTTIKANEKYRTLDANPRAGTLNA